MNSSAKYNLYFYLSLLFAVWFMLTSGVWTYFANVVLSFPLGIISWILWRKGKSGDEKKTRYKIVLYILYLGVAVAVVSLLGFLITN